MTAAAFFLSGHYVHLTNLVQIVDCGVILESISNGNLMEALVSMSRRLGNLLRLKIGFPVNIHPQSGLFVIVLNSNYVHPTGGWTYYFCFFRRAASGVPLGFQTF